MLVVLIVGIIFGAIQLLLLIRFAAMLTSGMLNAKCILFGVLQFILPTVLLIGCALFRRQDLIWAATGMVASLLIGAIIKFAIGRRNLKGGDNNDV